MLRLSLQPVLGLYRVELHLGRAALELKFGEKLILTSACLSLVGDHFRCAGLGRLLCLLSAAGSFRFCAVILSLSGNLLRLLHLRLALLQG